MSECVLVPVYGRSGIRTRAKVDATDYPIVASRRWYLNGKGYAISVVSVGGHNRTTLMHRLILGVGPRTPLVDHISGDTLDNRRANLRPVTYSENGQNRHGRQGKWSSRFRGVSFCRRDGKWIAMAMKNRRAYYLGSFATEDQAAIVASAWRAEHMPFSRDARDNEKAEISGH